MLELVRPSPEGNSLCQAIVALPHSKVTRGLWPNLAMADPTLAPCCLSAAAIRLTRSIANETGACDTEDSNKAAALHVVSLWQEGHLQGRPQFASPSSSCAALERPGQCPAACAGACMRARDPPSDCRPQTPAHTPFHHLLDVQGRQVSPSLMESADQHTAWYQPLHKPERGHVPLWPCRMMIRWWFLPCGHLCSWHQPGPCAPAGAGSQAIAGKSYSFTGIE